MRVLLAIDGSSYSTAAVELVATRPWPPDTIVRVLMAVEPIMQPPDPWNSMVGVEALELARQELTSQADKLVKNVAEKLRKTGLMVDTEVQRRPSFDNRRSSRGMVGRFGCRRLTWLHRTKKIALGQCRAVGREPCSMFS
jgi:hypothetical protein